MYNMDGLGVALVLMLILGFGGIIYVAILAVSAFLSGSISTFGIVSGVIALLVGIPCLRYVLNFRLY